MNTKCDANYIVIVIDSATASKFRPRAAHKEEDARSHYSVAIGRTLRLSRFDRNASCFGFRQLWNRYLKNTVAGPGRDAVGVCCIRH
jgi:hypothetical protein